MGSYHKIHFATLRTAFLVNNNSRRKSLFFSNDLQFHDNERKMMQKYPVSRKMCSYTAAQFASYAISLNGNLSFEENRRLKCGTLEVKRCMKLSELLLY